MEERRLIWNPVEILSSDVVWFTWLGRSITQRMVGFGMIGLIIGAAVIFLSLILSPPIAYKNYPDVMSQNDVLEVFGLRDYKIDDMVNSGEMHIEKKGSVYYFKKDEVIKYNSLSMPVEDMIEYAIPRLVALLALVVFGMIIGKHKRQGKHLDTIFVQRIRHRVQPNVMLNAKSLHYKDMSEKRYR